MQNVFLTDTRRFEVSERNPGSLEQEVNKAFEVASGYLDDVIKLVIEFP